jgi:purine-binding chemotaxis protein CheW
MTAAKDTIVRDLAQVNAELQEQKARVETVDYKMITFSLAGKDFGVDIMNVKEIAKADKFTFVPNAASYVRGVYNLRGDIIPVIDLRTFFHLPKDKKPGDGQENMLILRINEQVYGTIVDKIDKVVGVSRETIQPPHPIFGDINIKYISGVVEKNGELYVILDVVRIFGQKEGAKEKDLGSVSSRGDFFVPPPTVGQAAAEQKDHPSAASSIEFLKEGLAALKHFAVSPINENWMRRRFAEWSATRRDADLQFRTASDADEYLAGFFSPFTASFWSENYAQEVKNTLPDLPAAIHVWQIGCGKGYETYSFACILKAKYPNAQIKIWANDNDIMAISQAPNMTYSLSEVPEYCHPFMVKGSGGHSFSQAVKDSIVFEYHDVLHDNPLPDLDIILVRDTLSFFSEQDQNRLIGSFSEKLKSHGMVILGKNEELPGSGWVPMSSELVSAFRLSA